MLFSLIFAFLAVLLLLLFKQKAPSAKAKFHSAKQQEWPVDFYKISNEELAHLKKKIIPFRSRLFLYSWIASFRKLFGALTSFIQAKSQINLLAIRQSLGLLLFGRGILHG